MRKGIVLLIVALLYSCGVFARPDSKVLVTDTSRPTVTLTQEQFDSLVSAASRSNQMELIAKEESNQMYEKYMTLVTIIIAVMGVLVAVVGVLVPILMNNDTKKKIEKHEEAIKESNSKIESHEKMLKGYEEKIKTSEASLSDYDKKLAEYGEKIAESVHTLSDYEKKLVDYDEKITKSEQTMTAHESKLKEQGRAIKEISERVAESSTTVKESKGMAGALFTQALNEEDIDKKIVLYTLCIEKDPQNMDAYNNLGVAYYGKKEYVQAIKNYDIAIKMNPQYAEAYYNRGNAYRREKDYDQSIMDYDKAIELNPQYAKAYINRGYAYMIRGNDGDYELAMNDFKTGLSLNPDELTRMKLENNRKILKAKMHLET